MLALNYAFSIRSCNRRNILHVLNIIVKLILRNYNLTKFSLLSHLGIRSGGNPSPQKVPRLYEGVDSIPEILKIYVRISLN